MSDTYSNLLSLNGISLMCWLEVEKISCEVSWHSAILLFLTWIKSSKDKTFLFYLLWCKKSLSQAKNPSVTSEGAWRSQRPLGRPSLINKVPQFIFKITIVVQNFQVLPILVTKLPQFICKITIVVQNFQVLPFL